MRRVGLWTVVVGMLIVRASSVWAAPPSDVLAYAVFAIQSASIGSHGRIQGDAGCLFDRLAIGQSTRVTGLAAAPSIALRRGGRASGGYFCGTIEGTSDACQALPNPLIDAPAVVLVGPASNNDVSAAKRTKATTPLPAGAYGTLTAATAAELTLAGGMYQFESIDLGARAEVVCLAACTVIVRGKVTMGQASRLGAGAGVAATNVVVQIAAQGASRALDAKSRVQVHATIYAPSAEVKIGSAAKVTGALVGSTVSVGPRARLQGPAGSS